PSCSTGFWVANTRNGSGRSWVVPPAVTLYSCIDCRSAAWVLGGVRLISSASTRLANTGPLMNLNTRRPVVWSSSSTSVPVMSAGMRSGVNWMRWNVRFRVSASVEMSSVLASPGTPTNSVWPRANSATSSCSITRRWPMIRLLISAMISSCACASSATASRSFLMITLVGSSASGRSSGSLWRIFTSANFSPETGVGRLLFIKLVLQLVAGGAFARRSGVVSLSIRLGEPAPRGRIERAHAKGLFVGGDRLGPLAAGRARHPERDRGDRVVVVGGDQRGRELDRAVELAELDQRARELADDERLGAAGQRLLVLDHRRLVLAARAQHAAEPRVLAGALADLLEPDVLRADAALGELDRLAGARLGVADLEVIAPLPLDGGPRHAERLGDGAPRALAVALRCQRLTDPAIADLGLHPADQGVDLGVGQRRGLLARQ